MTTERYEKWEPVEGVIAPAARAVIKADQGLVVTLMFSEIVDGLNSDLRVEIGRVPAYTVHGEFVHPLNICEAVSAPTLVGKWEDYAYPLLMVKNSQWLASFADSQLISYPNSVHYRFVTLDQIVDVLSNSQPEVSWVKSTEL